MTTSNNIGIIIVEKTGILKELVVKEYNEGELFKKCGFKKGDDFVKQTEWPLKVDGQKYTVALFAKTNGKANTEDIVFRCMCDCVFDEKRRWHIETSVYQYGTVEQAI